MSEPAASTGRAGGPPVGGAPAGDSELLGRAAPNQHYLGQRLLYREGDVESLDPLCWRFAKALFVHWLIWNIAAIIGTLLIALIFFKVSLELTAVLVVIWNIAATIWIWCGPVWVAITEWRFMLDGKGGCADEAFEHVASAFKRRATPTTRPKVHRIMLGQGQSRDYLYVQDGVFRGYVAAFSYGRDLYVGWTYWWRLSAVHWLWLGLTRLVHHLTLRGSQLHAIHRYDSAKALREAIHGAAREGLDAASGLVAFEGAGTVGSDLPVEEIGQPRGRAPVPGGGAYGGADPFGA